MSKLRRLDRDSTLTINTDEEDHSLDSAAQVQTSSTGGASQASVALAPPTGTATVDLTASGNFGVVNDVVFAALQIQGAGAGAFPAFLQMVHSGSEQGYNTDARPVQFNESNAATHNHSLLLANIPLVEGDGTNGTVEGLLYREFLFDANEGNGGNNEFLSLDLLQIFQETTGNLIGFTPGSGFGVSGEHLVYDLDAGGDHWIALNAGLSSGSGQSDIRVLIPNSLFDQSTPYVYLYSAFGLQGGDWVTNNGNEEWAVRNGQSGPGGGEKAAFNIDKVATVPGGTADHAGEVITYAITVANTGNLSLTGITVDDPSVSDLTRGSDISGNNDNVLNVGEIWSFTAHHTVTQEEIDSNGGGRGAINNTATADSDQTAPDTASTSVLIEQHPSATLMKQAVVPGGTADTAGEVINYTMLLTNNGNMTLTTAVVTDPMATVVTPILNFNAPVLDPNVQLFVAIYDGDFNLGDTNQNGVWDAGETFQFAYPGDISLDGIHDPGEVWQAINLGDTNNDGIHQAGETWVGDTNQNGVEDPGERWQFKNLGDTNQNHLQDSGETWQYVNVGDVNQNGVQDAGENWGFRNVGDTNQNGFEDPGETFQYYNVGDTNQNGVEDPGETFQFLVTNGVTGVDANNDGFNDGDTNQDGKLNIGEMWQYAYTHTVAQDEIDNGGVVDPGLTLDNTATAHTDQVDPIATASASVPIEQRPEVTLVKSAAGGTYNDVNGNGRPDAGDTISYAFTVTNSGNMTLHDIDVSDPLVTVSGTTIASLAPGASDGTSFTGSYTIQQADIDAGFLDNTADATGSTGGSQGQAVTDSDSEHVTLPQVAHLTLDETAAWVDGDNDGFADPGEQVHYTLMVTNDGNVTLSTIAVNDPLLGGPMSGPASGDADNDGKLDVGETWTYAANYGITQADIDAGTVHNEATASASGPQGQPAIDTHDNDAALPRNAAVTLDKSGTWVDADHDGFADVGEEIHYIFTVTNSGNVTLHDIGVSDTDGDVLVTGTLIASLAPGAADDATWSATHTITQEDVNKGFFDNTATVQSDLATASSGTEQVVLPGPNSQDFFLL